MAALAAMVVALAAVAAAAVVGILYSATLGRIDTTPFLIRRPSGPKLLRMLASGVTTSCLVQRTAPAGVVYPTNGAIGGCTAPVLMAEPPVLLIIQSDLGNFGTDQ